MILAREQINRYLRHIIMPEISGPGQKKLLEAAVFVCGESIEAAAPAIYYLAAAGIGRINCRLETATGFDRLAADIRDLNSDVALALADGADSQFRIFLGSPAFIVRQRATIAQDFLPAVIALHKGWQGGIQVCKELAAAETLLAALAAGQQPAGTGASRLLPNRVFSRCLSGALGVMEIVKLILAIGETTASLLCFDLLSMEFRKSSGQDLDQLAAELGAVKPEDCRETRLEHGKVLIVGTGGLGSPAAYALAAAGVGTIGLVDYDVVEISNLNRQILHAASRIGMPKVESAAVFLKQLNPQLTVNVYNTSLTKANVYDILAGYDVVIVAVDNFPARFLLNDACFFAGKPMIDAGVLRFAGSSMTVVTPAGPCYRCTLPAIPSAGSVPSCSETGVLGALPGIMGFIQSAEAAKLLSGQGQLLRGRVVYLDGLFSRFLTLRLHKADNCALCGPKPTIHELQEYEFVCADAAEQTAP
ncbi:ThiF family adenylyltransferase [Sporomusa termitida]|uniref:Thiazole biosynthesis adenylyltransferase ThiF n=1 Tax=Sporomusa termitida TaxID=2377 RepID=A0A517DPR1_9FIRM|nr:ThiF family adenylyltransferase [Sporomusa termitida]QDR79350.1 thiazole biosynthesis adenylyltransferase ThiF [Sporomusa termitida]